MNGRIYDPKLARFMQADPFIDGVSDSQGYNRYTYVRNNPLAYTDPTGFKRSGGLKRWQKTAKAAMGPLGNSSTGRQLFQVVGTMACGPAAPLCAAAISSWTTFASGGNGKMALEAGARTYASAYISGEIGNSFGELKTPGQIFRASVAHGTLGGVMNVLGGGKFGHGFASAFMSKFILTHLDLKGDIDKKIWGTLASRTFVAAMVGGTISEATGGKFANGAIQSALQWVYNAESEKFEGAVLTDDELTELSTELRDQTLKMEKALSVAIQSKDLAKISEITGIDVGWLKAGLDEAEIRLLTLQHAVTETGISYVRQNMKIAAAELIDLALPARRLGKLERVREMIQGPSSRLSDIQVFPGKKGNWQYSYNFHNVKITRNFRN